VQEDFVVEKANGLKIVGTLYTPMTEEKLPLIIMLHGFGASCELLRRFSDYFNQAGYAFAVFDFCGGGPEVKSEGAFQDMTILTEIEDLSVVVEYFKNHPKIDADRIALLGESMGGLVACCYCAKHRDMVSALALWYPAFVIPHDAKKRYDEGITEAFGLDMNPDFDKIAKDIDVIEMIREYGKDILILHGDEDELVPLFYSEHVVEECEGITFHLMRGAGHGFSGENDKKATDYTIEFLKTHL
jgi:hypothetical protein